MRYGLIGIDCFSKLLMGSVTKEQSDVHYCDTLKRCFEMYGIPRRIHTDNGGPFVSECKFLKL